MNEPDIVPDEIGFQTLLQGSDEDWRELRLLPNHSGNVSNALHGMAMQVRQAMTIRSQPRLMKGDIEVRQPSNAKRLSPHKIEDLYKNLSPTQRKIIYALYTEVYPAEISVDDLFQWIKKKKSEEIAVDSTAELYYRLKDLKNMGLIATQTFQKITIVSRIPQVAKALYERQHLDT